MRAIRVGTRGSKLALAQTMMVARELVSIHSGLEIELVTIKTTGDMHPDVPFSAVGAKGMFVKEIEEALLSGDVDFAVHSLKDMPGELADGLSLAATPVREDPRDALVSPHGGLNDLGQGARIGTSSLRRRTELLAVRPDLHVEELRGNLDTRLRKLDEGLFDAILLACAGLERMGMRHRIRERLSVEQFVPPPGQGALALEIRTDDGRMREMLLPLNDSTTSDAVTAERSFQATLNVGCTLPVGGHGIVDEVGIRFLAMIGSTDGAEPVRIERRGVRAMAAALGRSVALELLDGGWQPTPDTAG